MIELEERDGIVFTHGSGDDPYRRRWEQEAVDFHVCSAIATRGDADDVETLTAKVNPLWRRFPRNLHVETLVEIGSGYGRIPLWLSRERALSCTTYIPVDIAEQMLRHLLSYRERYRFFPEAEVRAVCGSAHELPIDDGSVDLVLSSTAFLHMGKRFVARALREVARVLKPGGDFIFDGSFPNALNLANVPPRLKPRRRRVPHHMRFYRRAEIETLLRDSGLTDKAGGAVVGATTWGLLPKSVMNRPLPLTRRINAAIGEHGRLEPILAVLYGAWSEGFLQ